MVIAIPCSAALRMRGAQCWVGMRSPVPRGAGYVQRCTPERSRFNHSATVLKPPQRSTIWEAGVMLTDYEHSSQLVNPL